jgi:hypothetical protein
VYFSYVTSFDFHLSVLSFPKPLSFDDWNISYSFTLCSLW